MSTIIKFNSVLSKTDPQQHPVVIIGQLRHLSILKFEHVCKKLEPRVSAETFNSAIGNLHPSPTDFCPLYLNAATVVALPIKSSRHNTTSRAHALTKLVKTHAMTVTESILVGNPKNLDTTFFFMFFFYVNHRLYVIKAIYMLVHVLLFEHFHYIQEKAVN